MGRSRVSRPSAALGALLLLAAPAAAQRAPDSVPATESAPAPHSAPPRSATSVWPRAGLLAVGAAAVFAVDEPLHRFLQRNRTPALDAMADGARQGGQWQFHIAFPIALALTGAAIGEPGVVHAAVDVAAASATAGLAVMVLKNGFGRERPTCLCGSLEFEPFGSGASLPSGHTAAAFAAATALAGRLDQGWMRAGLYGAASLVAWSRMNDDKHWLSDVVAGAAIGVAAGRLTRGRLGTTRSGPTIAAAGGLTAVGWSLTF